MQWLQARILLRRELLVLFGNIEASKLTFVLALGQLHAWNSQHRKLCKQLPRFTSTYDYTTSPEHVRLESLLLARTITEHYLPRDKDSVIELSSDAKVLLALLPHPRPPPVPPLPKLTGAAPDPTDPKKNLAESLSNRSLNNHWVVYSSELTPTANAIYPVASRTFNHSCLPSAIPVYRYGETDNKGPKMQIRALTTLHPGDEVRRPVSWTTACHKCVLFF